jgi:5-methylcytosine-specific restriction protein A
MHHKKLKPVRVTVQIYQMAVRLLDSNRISGKKLNKLWNINAQHALYREDGKWYHHLKKFPGALCDTNGYVIFHDKNEYLNSKYLQHGHDLHVSIGISSIPGYIKKS